MSRLRNFSEIGTARGNAVGVDQPTVPKTRDAKSRTIIMPRALDYRRSTGFSRFFLHLSQGRTWLAYGRYRKAIARANAASRRNNWPEAIRRWRSVIEGLGEDAPPKAFLALSKAHRCLGNSDAAEAVLREGRAKHPSDMRLAAKAAKIARARKRWPDAVAVWQSVMKKLDGSTPASVYVHLSRAYRSNGELTNAQKLLSEAVARHPSDVNLLSERAEIAMAQQAWCQAADYYRAVLTKIQTEPDFASHEALVTACRCLARFGDCAPVFAAVQQAKRPEGENKALLAVEGIAYLRSAQMDAARTL